MSIRYSLVLLLIITVTGCNRSQQDQAAKPSGDRPAAEAKGEYNPHDVPITEEQKAELRKQAAKFHDAVAKLKELRNATEEETKNGIPQNPHNAHQALDKADLLLQWLPGIARDSGVPNEKWESVTTTANDLRTLFEQVHQNIDNKKDPNFASVAAEIDQKISQLEQISP
jgi:cell division protein ZapA (FtsZ GTPase activity inhibitor)